MTYEKRVPLLVCLDSIIVLTSIFVGYLFLHPYTNLYTEPMLWISSITLLFSHHLFAGIYHLYQKAWEYASVGELKAILEAVTFSIVVTALIQSLVYLDVYFRVLGITWMMHILLIGGSRFSWRVFRDRYITPNPDYRRTLIVGAGAAGTMVARQLLKQNKEQLYPVAFVDDDLNKHRLQIFGIEVKGRIQDIPWIVEKDKIQNIVIAIPSLSQQEINNIYKECSKTKANTKILPSIEHLVTGKVSINQIRDVEVEDLLGRDPIELDIHSIKDKLTCKTVLVTGAGGSIGSEICRQIAAFSPKQLLLLGHGENSIYTIDRELKQKYQHRFNIIPVIADVQDQVRILEIMEEYRPDVVYHAAAHKHVPLMEENPAEAVKNNIIGTRNVAVAADAFGVKNFVLISTDKAVNPLNVMGATKRIAEMMIQNMAKESNTKFVAVRFGNVLGSRGSVIPLFKQQIKEGGPITVTHPEMTRYFMTIPEASKLVIQAGALARGGEIFVLDMGDPVRIVDLAKNLITLSGYSIEEIGITYTGIRPGEKMSEELLNENEGREQQIFPKIFVGKAEPIGKKELSSVLDTLLSKGETDMRERLLKIANTKIDEHHHTTGKEKGRE